MSLEEQKHGEDLLRTSREVHAVWFDLVEKRATPEQVADRLLAIANRDSKLAATLLGVPEGASRCGCGGASFGEIGSSCAACLAEEEPAR